MVCPQLSLTIIQFNTIPPCPSQTAERTAVKEEEWRESTFHEGNWCRVFVAGCTSYSQPVQRTSTGPHPFFDHQQTPEEWDVVPFYVRHNIHRNKLQYKLCGFRLWLFSFVKRVWVGDHLLAVLSLRCLQSLLDVHYLVQTITIIITFQFCALPRQFHSIQWLRRLATPAFVCNFSEILTLRIFTTEVLK